MKVRQLHNGKALDIKYDRSKMTIYLCSQVIPVNFDYVIPRPGGAMHSITKTIPSTALPIKLPTQTTMNVQTSSAVPVATHSDLDPIPVFTEQSSTSSDEQSTTSETSEVSGTTHTTTTTQAKSSSANSHALSVIGILGALGALILII